MMIPEGVCLTFKTTPPLPEPSSVILSKSCSFKSPNLMIDLLSSRKELMFPFCSSLSSRLLIDISIASRLEGLETINALGAELVPLNNEPALGF